MNIQSTRMAIVIAAPTVTVGALWLGAISGGAGHGDYVLARLLLPFACVAIGSHVAVVIALAVLQWPVYFVTMYCMVRDRIRFQYTIVLIAVLHTVVAFLTFTVAGP